jgi:two-component system, NtrC family, response regulator AtoC
MKLYLIFSKIHFGLFFAFLSGDFFGREQILTINLVNAMKDESYTKIIGINEKVQTIRELIERVAGTGLSVLITGETGTGKELVARSLYEHSDRKNNPFVKVNCAALPDTLMESELFGYEQGAFTGANQKRRGKFQLANNGTLFLDEIGDMSFYLQSKLLRVLQDGTFSPLGSEREVKSNGWIIAASNKDLESEIQKKNFRTDLFYRLNTINIHVQPLRERPEDIPLLVRHYFNMYSNQLSRHKTFLSEITNDVMEKMVDYHWPGNVRELQNVIKRIVVLGCSEETIGFLSLKREHPIDRDPEEKEIGNNQVGCDNIWENLNIKELGYENKLPLKEIGKVAVDKAEKQVILHVLSKTGWNRKKAIKILNVSYPALLYKMKDLNIYPN